MLRIINKIIKKNKKNRFKKNKKLIKNKKKNKNKKVKWLKRDFQIQIK